MNDFRRSPRKFLHRFQTIFKPATDSPQQLSFPLFGSGPFYLLPMQNTSKEGVMCNQCRFSWLVSCWTRAPLWASFPIIQRRLEFWVDSGKTCTVKAQNFPNVKLQHTLTIYFSISQLNLGNGKAEDLIWKFSYITVPLHSLEKRRICADFFPSSHPPRES